MKAVIYKSTGSWYIAETETGQRFQARMKGIFKLDEITSTNPIAVGDKVEIELENELEHTATITKIHDRKNYVARKSPHNKWQQHIIASNVDQCLLFATLKNPKTSLGFIDRFLVSCEMHHIPAIIVFNKSDLHGKKEDERLALIKQIYENINYTILPISMLKKEGLDDVKSILKNKTTLISGHSGTGKSTFINHIIPELEIKTLEVSDWSGKGMHTTTFAQMYNLPYGGRIIDTPGIRELGLTNIEKTELSGYFPEMKKVLQECKFNNCQHINEPQCAVKQAIANNLISFDRYQSYYNILESLEK
ncbi:MAG: ribosome small subunit-dependent GTPase A [Chitinophagaceae bacterium]|nr:ribosome small subunit-dependent GTPase A [Chitinophagaceae bacterium]